MLEEWVQSYGYIAIFVLTFFEGEAILVLGAIAANHGYLRIEWVVTCAIIGSMFGDQLWFYVGRKGGAKFLEKRPGWHKKMERALRLLNKHNTLFILSFRFFYGLRTVSSFAVGLTAVSGLRYLVLNAIAAVIWAVALGAAGYLIGEALQVFLGRVEHYQKQVLIGLAAIGVIIWLIHVFRERSRAKKDAAEMLLHPPPDLPPAIPGPSPPPQNVESK